MTSQDLGRIGRIRHQVQTAHNKYNKFYPALFFVAGFLFDVVTLSRIDDWFSILQQGVYLFVVLQILKYRLLEESGTWQPSPRLAKLWHYNIEILHFILGSLLSVYSLFYFVSSSLSASFLFLAVMFILLVANELPSLQSQGLMIKFSMLFLCLFSFLFIIVPIVLGFIGLVPFTIALAIGTAIPFALFKQMAKQNVPVEMLKKSVVYPGVGLAALLLSLYILKLLPPIPLSVQYIGIYHSIERVRPTDNPASETLFVLKYDRPFWKFWQSGAQDFVAEPTDKIHCFIRVFAPVNFHDKVVFHWMKNGPRGWETMDRITNDISGGRTNGYRGFAIKSNYDPGDWRVLIETTDGREISRINFTVALSEEKNLVRELRQDVF